MSQTLLTLYTRKQCSLCDKAKAAILELKGQWNFTLEEIDIDQSDDLTEKYGIMIPVVHINGVEVAFGIIDKNELSNRLQEKTTNF